MTGVFDLTAKQLEIVKNGAVLTGDTIKVKDRLNRLSKDQVFYFPERMGGDNKWHVDVRLAEHIARYAGEGIDYDVSLSKVSEKSIRFDCMDKRDGKVYRINVDEEWKAIHATKGDTNEKDRANSNNNLICPEDGCDLKLYTRMGSQQRELRRKPTRPPQPECMKCGKFNAPTRSRPEEPPPEDLKHQFRFGAIPRYNGLAVVIPELEPIKPPAPDSVEDTQSEPVIEGFAPTIENFVAFPEPGPIPPDSFNNMRSAGQGEAGGGRVMTKMVLVPGAVGLSLLALLFIVVSFL